MFARQTVALACFLTRCNAGINIPINNATMAITTKCSMSVKAFLLIHLLSFVSIVVNSQVYPRRPTVPNAGHRCSDAPL